MRELHDKLKRAVRNKGRRYKGLGRWLCEPVRPGKAGNLAGYLAKYVNKAQVKPALPGKRRARAYSYSRRFPRAIMLPFTWDCSASRCFKIQKAMVAAAFGIEHNFKRGMRDIFGKRWGYQMIKYGTRLVPEERVGLLLLGRMRLDGEGGVFDDWSWLMGEQGLRAHPDGPIDCRHGGEVVNGMPGGLWNHFVIEQMYASRTNQQKERHMHCQLLPEIRDTVPF
jgi:hypothetical protein